MRGLLPLIAAIALLACGHPSPDATVQSPSPVSSPLAVGAATNGATVDIHVGQSVRVTLDSWSWTFHGSSNAAVLRPVGQASPVPYATCAPILRGDCGSLALTFQGLAQGSADISASRSDCGEASRCLPAESTYLLHVVVSGS